MLQRRGHERGETVREKKTATQTGMGKNGRTFQAGYIRIVLDILIFILLDTWERSIARSEATSGMPQRLVCTARDHHFRFICAGTTMSAATVDREVEGVPLAACMHQTFRTLPCMRPCGHRYMWQECTCRKQRLVQRKLWSYAWRTGGEV